jgi:hypothetical protein
MAFVPRLGFRVYEPFFYLLHGFCAPLFLAALDTLELGWHGTLSGQGDQPNEAAAFLVSHPPTSHALRLNDLSYFGCSDKDRKLYGFKAESTSGVYDFKAEITSGVYDFKAEITSGVYGFKAEITSGDGNSSIG